MLKANPNWALEYVNFLLYITHPIFSFELSGSYCESSAGNTAQVPGDKGLEGFFLCSYPSEKKMSRRFRRKCGRQSRGRGWTKGWWWSNGK